VIARRHPSVVGGPALIHADAYRLSSAEEVDDLDLTTDSDVVCVEWGRDRAEQLADAHLLVEIEVLDEGRLVTITGVGRGVPL
jgi:tRNA threonylcarbamoyladenosine biosynthesis protein TsaE